MATYKKEKDGTWTYRIYYEDASGKRREKKGTKFARKKDAQDVAEELETELKKNANIDQRDRLFTDYYREWCEAYKYGSFTKATDSEYRTAEKIVAEYFSGVKLGEITAVKYQQFLNDYSNGDLKEVTDEFGKKKKIRIPRAKTTVRKYHYKISACLSHAFHNGIIPVNVVYKPTIKGDESQDPEEKFLSESEVQKVIEQLENNLQLSHTSRYMLLLQAGTGCRIGESMALTFDNFDFDKKTLTINKTWDYKYDHTFKDTKNGVHRTIHLDQNVIDRIEPYYRYQRKQALTSVIKNHNNLLFVDDKMELVTVDAVNKALKRACRRAGVQEITSHGLRHTYASIMIMHGMDIQVVAERLGDSVETIHKVYSHVLDEMRDRSREEIDKISAILFTPKKIGKESAEISETH